MLDLRTAAVIDWLHLVRPIDPKYDWPPPIRPIETTEPVEPLLAELGDLLDLETRRGAGALATKLQHPEFAPDLQILLAQFGAARPLRMLHWLNESDVAGHFAIISTLLPGDNSSARALSATISAVTRRATLARLFAPERLTELQTAVETMEKEAG